jgi:drug/metabolite transporter (DMT)-like permease
VGNSLFLILFAIACSVAGQLTLKTGMNVVGQIDAGTLQQPLHVLSRMMSTPFVFGGLGLYALAAVAWLAVLSRVPLSIAYPNVALTYAFTPALASLFLGETITPLRWVGIGIICCGVIVVSRS